MDFDEILINLDFINLKVKIINNKISSCELINENKENYSKEYKKIFYEIKDYFYGKKKKFDLNLLDFKNLTPFKREVLLYLSDIPRGKVTTYKKVAIKVSGKNSYRAVGNVLKLNPFPIIVPCHRVIKSDLSLGDYGYGRELKRKLLLFEGVQFIDENRVNKNFVL